jgi:dTDP-4-dehydrorhamnose 3,5-epimerase
MSRLAITALALDGLKSIERMPIGDQRGSLTRLFCANELAEAGWHLPIAQINHTQTSHKGAIRGLHFQRPPYAEMKLVTCIRGRIWDVAVDLRRDSRTFLQWQAKELSAENNQALLIPQGFAHGFQALTDDVELIYLHTMFYHPEAESGLNAFDPALAVEWPLSVTNLSARDKSFSMIDSNFVGVDV